MFGYTNPELIGNNINMLMPAPYHENHDKYLAQYLESGVRKNYWDRSRGHWSTKGWFGVSNPSGRQ